MYGKFSLNQKLLLLVGILAAFCLIEGAAGVFAVDYVSDEYRNNVMLHTEGSRLLSAMRGYTKDFSRNVVRMAIPGATPEEQHHVVKKLDDYETAFSSRHAKYSKLKFPQEQAAPYAKMVAAWKDFNETGRKAADLLRSKDRKDFEEGMTVQRVDFRKSYEVMFASLDTLVDYHDKDADRLLQVAIHGAESAGYMMIALTLFGGIFSFAAGTLFSRALSKSLMQIVSQLSAGASEVANASSAISEASTELSSSATQQASAVQQTLSSIEEVSAMVGKNAENAKLSAHTSQESHGSAGRGKQAVDEMNRAIGEINHSNDAVMNQVEQSNQRLVEIVQLIEEIGSKTKVINDIVFQTRLLSFNASVEAARAGEHGKGFAVVAEEVGNLALMSGNAAKEISQMLETSTKRVQGLVTETKAKVEQLVIVGKEKVKAGTDTAVRCQLILDEIVTSSASLKLSVDEIAVASKEQAQGVHEITEAMAQLDQVTQQNTQSAEQSAAATERLNSQADLLRKTVNTLLTMVTGEAKRGQPQNEAAPLEISRLRAA